MSKSNAFKVGYLLGVEEGLLERDFKEDFEASDNLNYLKMSGKAELLRSLSRVRQSLIRFYPNYKGCTSLPANMRGFDMNDVDVLNKWEINLDGLFRIKANVTQIVNHLTKEIDKIVVEVLTDLKIPYVDKIKMYFYLHELNERNGLSTLYNKIKSAKLPYGQFVAKYSKVSESIPYSLSSDTNLYITGHNFCKARYVANAEIESVDWDDFKPAETIVVPVDYIETTNDVNNNENTEKSEIETDEVSDYVVVEGSSIIDEEVDTVSAKDGSIIKEDNTEEVEVVAKSSVLGVVKESEKVHTKTSTSVHKDISKSPVSSVVASGNELPKAFETYLSGNEDVYAYVDCDNVNFFAFMALLPCLEKHKNIAKIKLFVDEKSSNLWKHFFDLFTTSCNIEIVNITRIKGEKSITDMKICGHMYTDVLLGNKTKILLLSSDSDFYAIFEDLHKTGSGKNVSFAVGYSQDCTNGEYILGLDKIGVVNFDLSGFDRPEIYEECKDRYVKFLLACNVVNIPPAKLDVGITTSIVFGSLSNETEHNISYSEVRNMVIKYLPRLIIQFMDEKNVRVTIDDIHLVIPLPENSNRG